MSGVDRSMHLYSIFFFNDTATTEIYTLSLHDALPILMDPADRRASGSYYTPAALVRELVRAALEADRKSTRLNSSHDQISYAVFCLKKKIGSASKAISAPTETT